MTLIKTSLYRSTGSTASAVGVSTSLKKVYISLIIALAAVLAGGGAYYYYMSSADADAIRESEATKPKIVTPAEKIANINVRWIKFLRDALALEPQSIVSDGEESFVGIISDTSLSGAVAKKDSLAKFCRTFEILDTFTTGTKFQIVVKGDIQKGRADSPVQPVEKKYRSIAMNFIDSIAVSAGLSEPSRQTLSVDNFEGGELYRYLFVSEGRNYEIARFLNDIAALHYAVTPTMLQIEKNDSTYSLKVVWGLFRFDTTPDTTQKTASANPKR
jgi:hypothetical protein